MSIQEFYEKIGGNYEVAVSRMINDEKIKKFLTFFLADESYQTLIQAMENGSCEDAFRAAHTLKGVCQNMSFAVLSKYVEKITEELRANEFEQAKQTLPDVISEYQKVIDGINML